MGMNVKGIKNEKHAGIQKTAEGKSVDYELLETIKTADISTKEGLNKRNKAIVSLFDKYEYAIKASRNFLIEMCKGHPTALSSDIIENYKYDCYEHFMMAVNGMDLSRIQHMKGSYTFYIQLIHYLEAYNRKIVTSYCGGSPTEKALKESKDEWGNLVLTNDEGVKFLVKPGDGLTLVRNNRDKITKVVDFSGEIVFSNKKPKAWSKFNAYNVRSEWTRNSDGEEVSIFDTNSAGSSTIEGELERKEESKVLGEAIEKAYAKFTELQKSIWNNRLTQSAEQYETKVKANVTADKLAQAAKPKYEDLAKKCKTTPDEIKSNLKAMRLVVEHEIAATNRKYHTDINF